MLVGRHPFGQVYIASVGVSGSPVDDSWDAREREAIWFAKPSNTLSRGYHLFALGVGHHSAVLGLYEITSAGTRRRPNPWGDPRWPFAVDVRALATVPLPEAEPVTGLTAPRGTANRVRDEAQIHTLYARIAGYEIVTSMDAAQDGVIEDTGGADRGNRRRRSGRRPFDPSRSPSVAEPGATDLTAEEIGAAPGEGECRPSRAVGPPAYLAPVARVERDRGDPVRDRPVGT